MKINNLVIITLALGLVFFGCLGQPSKPVANLTVCNATCQTGYTQAAYPNCTCIAPVTSAPNVTANVTPIANVTASAAINCSTNESCFYTNLASCSPAVYNTDFQTQGYQEFQITIKGPKDNKCSVETLVTKHTSSEFVGTKMECAVPQNATMKESYIREFNPIGASVLTSCAGTYVNAIKKAFGG